MASESRDIIGENEEYIMKENTEVTREESVTPSEREKRNTREYE